MWKRWTGCAVVAGAVLAAATGFAGHMLSGQPARTTGTMQVRGISAPITIIRDRAGVPHIFAASEPDAVFGLGFVHSQDRRLQMELLRRYGRGESAAMAGASALANDRLMRTLGVWRLAQQEATLLAPPSRRLHEAYAAGVNEASREGGWPSGMLARALVAKADSWTVADSILVLKLATLAYATQYREELLRAALARQTGSRLRWFVAVEPAERAVRLVAGNGSGLPRREHTTMPAGVDYAAALRDLGGAYGGAAGVGSNSWVVDGARSSTGKPLLASDPHMALTAPSGVYAAHLSAPGLQVTGVGIPGLPGFFHGHNDRIAWGVTVTGADTEDTYLEELAGEGGMSVRRPAGTEPLQTYTETIAVRDGASVVHHVRRSSHGALISDAMPSLLTAALPSGQPANRYALALNATALKPAPPGWYLEIARATNWAEFRGALSRYSGPTFNFTYADIDGHIGFQMAGRLPARTHAAPAVPVAGWNSGAADAREVPFDALPSARDPRDGWLATANAPLAAPAYPLFVSERWGDLSWRVGRVRDLLQQRARISPSDMASMQLDVHQESMRSVVGWAREVETADPQDRQFLEVLGAWDYRATIDSAAQALAEAFRVELMREVFGAELPEALLEPYIAMPTFAAPALEAIMSDPQAEFFGRDVNESRARRRLAIGRAIAAARRSLERRFGPPYPPSWGRVHTLTFQSPLAQGSGLIARALGRWLNVGPFPLSGSNTTVNAAAWHPQDWFTVTHGSGYRQIIDLGDLSASRYLPPPPGQSEHASSPFSSNLAAPAARGEYFRMLWTRAEIEADATSTLTLRP